MNFLTNSSHLESPILREDGIESDFISRLSDIKYDYRRDITDRAALERNFRAKFEELNRVRLTDSEFARLLDEIVTADVFAAAKTLRSINSFTRDDGTPLNYSRMKAESRMRKAERVQFLHSSFQLPTNPSPRRAMEQIVEYKNDPGNGYTRTLLCFMQLFIVGNRDRTYYFANNNARHFAFNADERFLPVYELADEDNKKITHLNDFAERFLKKCDLGRTISRYMVLIAPKGYANAKQWAFKTADIQDYSAMATTCSSFHLN